MTVKSDEDQPGRARGQLQDIRHEDIHISFRKSQASSLLSTTLLLYWLLASSSVPASLVLLEVCWSWSHLNVMLFVSNGWLEIDSLAGRLHRDGSVTYVTLTSRAASCTRRRRQGDKNIMFEMYCWVIWRHPLTLQGC